MTKQEFEDFATTVKMFAVPDEVISVKVDQKVIHLKDDDFFGLFKSFDAKFEGGHFRYHASTTVCGVMVFCLTNRDLERWEDYV